MNKKQRTILWCGVAVIVLMGLYPPWFRVAPSGAIFYEERVELVPTAPAPRVSARDDMIERGREAMRQLSMPPPPPPPTLWDEINAPLKRLLPSYGWLFDPPQLYRIDTARLALQWIMIGLLAGAGIWSAKTSTQTAAPK